MDCVQKLRFFVHDGRELAERVGSCMHEGRVSAEKVGSCIHEGVFFAEWMGSCMHEGGVFTESVGSCMHERAAAGFWAALCMHRACAELPERVPEVRRLTGLCLATLPGAVWVRFMDWELRACMFLWWRGFGRMRAGVLASVLMGSAGGFYPQIAQIFADCFQGVG